MMGKQVEGNGGGGGGRMGTGSMGKEGRKWDSHDELSLGKKLIIWSRRLRSFNLVHNLMSPHARKWDMKLDQQIISFCF